MWAWVCLCFLLAHGDHFACGRTPRFPHDAHRAHGNLEKSAVTYKVEYFTQVIDHFSFRRENEFQQRYLIEKTYWSAEKGPIFLYCGNEGDIEWFARNSGFLWEIAPVFGALILFPEVSIYVSNYFSNFLGNCVCFF